MSAKKLPTTSTLIERPPVVAVMGHIDHGKSTLLDYIRKTNTCAKEAGGITQHIAAYEVCHTRGSKKNFITFLDTPGHAAFKGIRVRGANVADIAILIVSAEEGVKPQTIEALNCIKEAGIPYIVGINKMDSPKANLERTKQSLAEHEIYIEGYGGQISWAGISGKTGEGVPELLDLVLLTAELAELKGDLSKKAEGIVIESKLDPRKGISGTLIIKDGTLKKGTFVVCDTSLTPVRAIEDFTGARIEEAHFSSPVKLLGFDSTPTIGEIFRIFDTKREAEAAVAEAVAKKVAAKNTKGSAKNTASTTSDASDSVTITLIIKADVSGTMEAIQHEIGKIKNDKVQIKLVQSGVGTITEADVKMAVVQPGTKILGFNVAVDTQAKMMAERLNVETHSFDIIYKLIEWIEEAVAKNVPKVTVEEVSGTAKILKVFSKTKDKQVVGGRVLGGIVNIGADVRIMRRDAEIGKGKIRELQQKKEKVSEVNKDSEFGTMIESKIEIAPGDQIECYSLVTK